MMRVRLAPVSVLVLLVACASARGTAERQLQAAQEAVAGLGPDARAVVPDQVAAIEEAMKVGQQAIESGDYEAASASLVQVPEQVKAVADSLPVRRAALQAEMDTLTIVVPRNLAAIQAELDRIARTRRLPGGMDRKGLEVVRQTQDSAAALWQEVQSEFKAGKLADALAKAHDLKARVSQALLSLGLVADERAWSNVTLPPG
jgi:hypothetical protein